MRRQRIKKGPQPKVVLLQISPTHFAVQLKNFKLTDKLKSIIKSYKGFYKEDKRYWVIKSTENGQKPYSDYNAILPKIKSYAEDEGIEIEEIPSFVFKALANKEVPYLNKKSPFGSNHNYNNDQEIDIKDSLPQALLQSLYKFQCEGIQFGIEHHGRVLIGDEMGVGKTVQALGIACLYKSEWPLLILAPSSLKYVWRDEIKKWLPDIQSIEVIKTGKDAFKTRSQIYILSYDLAKNIQDTLNKMTFHVAIADEAHYLKSRTAKRSKTLAPLLKGCKRVIMLSGTPMLSRPADLHNLLSILRPDVIPMFHEYGKRYCDPKPGFFGIDWNGASCIDELYLLLVNLCMIRRLKADVLSDLPSKRRQKVEIELDGKILKEIQKLLNDKGSQSFLEDFFGTTDSRGEAIAEDKKDGSGSNKKRSINREHKENIMKAYSLTGLAKVKQVTEFLQTLIDNETKFIVFAHHIEVMDRLEEYIKKATSSSSYIRIDGSCPPEKRHSLKERFQNSPQCLAAILSLTACSQGITLTACSTVVFAEMIWTPGIMDQAEDRVHRIGQKMSVNIYYLCGSGDCSFDGILYRIIKNKSEVISKALDGEEKVYEMEEAKMGEIKMEESSERRESNTGKEGASEKKIYNYFQFLPRKEKGGSGIQRKLSLPVKDSALMSAEKSQFQTEVSITEQTLYQDAERDENSYVRLDENEQTELLDFFSATGDALGGEEGIEETQKKPEPDKEAKQSLKRNRGYFISAYEMSMELQQSKKQEGS